MAKSPRRSIAALSLGSASASAAAAPVDSLLRQALKKSAADSRQSIVLIRRYFELVSAAVELAADLARIIAPGDADEISWNRSGKVRVESRVQPTFSTLPSRRKVRKAS